MSAAAAAAASTGALAPGTEGTYTFVVEWFDQQAAMMRQYNLLYFVLDETIELVSRDHAHSRRNS
jgi:hypothetical protein